MVKRNYSNNPNELSSELIELYKLHVIDKNLHENRNDLLKEYTAEFEMCGLIVIGDQTHNKLR